MQIVTKLQIITLALTAQVAQAQFQINPGTYDASELYDIISGNYNSYAAIWQDQLSSAKASLPGAYGILTSIYNTDDVPETFNPEFVSDLAEEMVKVGHTTVVDPQVNSNTLIFSTEPTGETSGSPENSSNSESETSEKTTPGQEDSSKDQSSDEDVFTLLNEDSEADSDSDTGTNGASPNTKPGVLFSGVGLLVALTGILSYI
ncbi:hypothetical protein COEREDRAFT_91307 [Coemansia reversa NRRL 1564]|uniref:FAS1 domain-containing protein n=1 Tax=Coemansia reversa (strain ATCC 12441 / NRRL 1564) TaxID=763665 RepID=A0A2G5BHH7_COERN|nr:hypothetical protein COEREDRAFT_91307 [Coemansia reversa NRRL 1564]|eukprot:PIA18470.1 hypothetical protein COEREDRAFT_91307 [Coemansia reversa NRRL 1564]